MEDITDATVEFRCPVEGCTYKAPFRIAGGSETDSDAHAERERILRDEHPKHPRGARKPKFTAGYLFKPGERAAVTGESIPTEAAPGIRLLIFAEGEPPHSRVTACLGTGRRSRSAWTRVVRVLGEVVRVVRFAAELVTGRTSAVTTERQLRRTDRDLIQQAADKIRRESRQHRVEIQGDQATIVPVQRSAVLGLLDELAWAAARGELTESVRSHTLRVAEKILEDDPPLTLDQSASHE